MSDHGHAIASTSTTTPVNMAWLRRALIGSAVAVVMNVLIALSYRRVTGQPLQGVMPITQATPTLAIWQIALASAAAPMLALPIAQILMRISHEPRRWFVGGAAIIALLAVIDPLSAPSPGVGNVVVAVLHLLTVLAGVLPLVDLVPELITHAPRTAPWQDVPAD